MQKTKSQSVPETWHFKLLISLFHLTGLSRLYFKDDLYSRVIFGLNVCLYLLEWVFCLQQVCGIFYTLAQKEYDLRKLFFYCDYVFLTLFTIVATHVLLFRKRDVCKCLQDSLEGALNCSEDQRTARRKYACMHSMLILCLLVFVPGAGLLVAVISPLARFVVRKERSLYVMRAIWYPVDVMSSRWCFWCAVVYESALVFHCVHTVTLTFTLFLHLTVTTRTKFDNMCLHLEENYSTGLTFDPKKYRRARDGWTLAGRLKALRTYVRVKSSSKAFQAEFEDLLYHRKNFKLLTTIIGDWSVLWRQSKLIQTTFAPIASIVMISGTGTTSLMTYLAVTEFFGLGSRAKKIAGATAFLFHVCGSNSAMLNISYGATLLEHVHENIRVALGKFNWLQERKELQRILILFHLRLNKPIRMKAFSFYPVNNETFSHNMSRAFSFIAFLFQLSRKK